MRKGTIQSGSGQVRHRGVPVLLGLLAILACPGRLHAGLNTLFSTFGPGDSYNTGPFGGWIVGGNPGDNFDTAVGFTIDQGIPQRLDTVEVAAYLSSGTNSLDVWLMDDSAGEPGTVLEAFNFTNLVSNPGSSILLGTSSLNPILNPATPYWLVLSAPHEDDTYAAWSLSGPALPGTVLQRTGASSWTSYSDSTLPALRLTGDPVVVPIPGALLLGTLGLGMAAARLKRRKVT